MKDRNTCHLGLRSFGTNLYTAGRPNLEMHGFSVEKSGFEHFYFSYFLWTVYLFDVENSRSVLNTYASKEENAQ